MRPRASATPRHESYTCGDAAGRPSGRARPRRAGCGNAGRARSVSLRLEINPFEISGDVPNAETVEAIKEVKRMKADPSLGKTYSNVDQMMEELLADV